MSTASGDKKKEGRQRRKKGDKKMLNVGISRASKTARAVKALIPKPDDLSSIPETHPVEGESLLSQDVL